MKLSKIDLSSVVAIAHSDGYLQLLLDRGEELEFLEIAAPVEAFEGLQHLSEIVAETATLPIVEEPIAMLPISSSMAAAIGYDQSDRILQVEFQSGAVYQYSDVEPETWEELNTSNSIGQFFNQAIKGQYESERIDNF